MIPLILFEAEAPLIIAHLQSLDNESKRLRFGYTPSDIQIDKYVSSSFKHKNSAWYGHLVDGRCISAIHVFIENNECELGISVSSDYRGKGLSNDLFDRALIHAKAQDVTRITMQCLSENAAMQHIARKRGMQIVTLGPGEKGASINIEPGNPALALAEDMQADVVSLIDAGIRNQCWLAKTLTNLLNFDFLKGNKNG